MKQKYFVADAFADKVFEGNPAGVCVLKEWLPDATMQAIAVENNLSETAFAVKEGDVYGLRWYTPGGEVDLCGHATMGAAYIIAQHYDTKLNPIVFHTKKAGHTLRVSKKDDLLEMDFPVYQFKPVPVTPAMEEALGMKILEASLGRDLLCVVENEDLVINANPDLSKVKALPDGMGAFLTAKGSKKYDLVSRCFFPKINVPEDPVTGSAHSHLIPFWSQKLGKTEFVARQASPRGGTLYCHLKGDRVFMSGRAVQYLEGEITF